MRQEDSSRDHYWIRLVQESVFTKVNPAQICANRPSPGIAKESTRKKSWYTQNLTKSSDDKDKIRVVGDDVFSNINSTNFCANCPTLTGQGNSHRARLIPLVNITGSWIYEKAFFKYQSHTNLCKSPSPGIARQSTQKKARDSQKLIKSTEVSPTSGIKNTMLREVGETWRPKYPTDDEYQIRVKRGIIFQKSIQYTFMKITEL